MHGFARHLHGTTPTAPNRATKGLILDQGWRYDLVVGCSDAIFFRGQIRALRQRAITLARLTPGTQVLDVGCGTGTLALAAQPQVGSTGRVVGIDPGAEQIARARAKAARRQVPVAFQVGVIERLPFPDQTFDVALSTLMMHHLPTGLKRQGIAEIARVLKLGGRLVIADFVQKRDRQGQAARFHAGGSSVSELVALVTNAGFSAMTTEDLRPRRFSAFPGAALLTANRN
jgi:ubiquinone/menaquinone biosynthesis C-methylase UbiE